MSAASELEKIAKEVAVCTRCSLCKTRTRTVPGEGSPNARLLFIGEAPGYHEDREGRPFVGPSGQLLNKLLNAIKIPREEVFIANVVKCRPPNNADPTPDQIAACKPYLDRQIAAINPRVIVTLGRFSMARYWPGQRISQVHGQPKIENARIHLAMFHPAAALRDTGRTLAMFKEDGLTIPSLLEQAEEIARTELWGYSSDEYEPDESQPVLAEIATPPEIIRATRATLQTVKEPPVEPHAPSPLPEAEVVKVEIAENPVVELVPVNVLAHQQGEPATLVTSQGEPAVNGVVKPARTRKPKVEAGNDSTGEVSRDQVKEKPARPATGRKKRQPVEAEQLTMF